MFRSKILRADDFLRDKKRNIKKLDLLIIIARESAVYGAGSLSGGPSVLASYLNSKGHSVIILDNNSPYKKYKDKEILKLISENEIGVVGFSINMLNAAGSYLLAKKIFLNSDPPL